MAQVRPNGNFEGGSVPDHIDQYRFHKIVQESFATHKPEVIQLYSKMTPAMERIHQNVISIMNACIKELKKCCSVKLNNHKYIILRYEITNCIL